MPKPRASVKAGGPAAKATAAAAKKAAKKKAAGAPGGEPASALIARANEALAYDDYEAALALLREAAAREPGNPEALDAYGSLLAEVGRAEEAVRVLQAGAEVAPDSGFEKYMYLGQLLEGEEALAATRRGVEILSAEAFAAGGGGAAAKQLCAALCSLAEMTLAAAESPEEVAEEVASLLQRARAADSGSPEPLQALASLRYEQGRADEALGLLRESMALWFKPDGSDDEEEDGGSEEEEGDGGSEEEEDEEEEDGMRDAAGNAGGTKSGGKTSGGSGEDKKAGAGGGGGGGAVAAGLVKPRTMSEDPGEDLGAGSDDGEREEASGEEGEEDEAPSFEFRFECAKLLLELDESTDHAIQVLEGLIAENDSVPDVWHLLALAYYSGGALEEASEVANHGAALLAKQRARRGGGGGGGGDGAEEGAEGCDDLAAAFEDLKAAIAEAGGPGGEGGGGGGGEMKE